LPWSKKRGAGQRPHAGGRTRRNPGPHRPRDLTGREIERTYADKGYRGHDAPKPLRVFITGQKRGVFDAIKRELRRRSAVEPVIGHMKSDGRLGRNYLKGRHGDRANAVLCAAGYNFRLILSWLRFLLRQILDAIFVLSPSPSALKRRFTLAS